MSFSNRKLTNQDLDGLSLPAPSGPVIVPVQDPGDSTATTVAEIVADHNQLLANLRDSGIIVP